MLGRHRHHARLRLDLHGTVNPKCATRNHAFIFRKAFPNQVVIARPRPKQDLAAFEGGPFGTKNIDIGNSALARHQDCAYRNDQGQTLVRALGCNQPQALSRNQIDPANIACPRLVFDDFGVHGANPFSR